ncbi:MAG: TRAP transporter small permease [Desulfobacterales bacterium]|nr:TRAP transporter small permease [Desulfobacterales bacterium]
MKIISKVLSCIFGYLCLGLSILVCVEVIGRKVFSVSLQGADELGGYVLAVGSCLAFCVALIGRNHMRIDIFHYRLPGKIQAILNWVAIVTLALFGLLLATTGFGIIRDTFSYHSTAPTPWATPLIYPQGFWYAGLFMFAVIGVILAFRATKLLLKNRLKELQSEFQPKAAAEELEEELENAARR